jgi:signal transduction histidine kinase
MHLCLRLAVWLMACVPLGGSLAAQPAPRSVLLLDQGFVGSPWYDAYSSAFRSAFMASAAPGIAVHVEHLDFGHFSGQRQEEVLRTYLRGKYQESPIKLIVAVGPLALQFALQFRAEFGSSVPVVFSVVDDDTIARLNPSNATGTILQYTLRDQITSAQALVPGLKHVALVGDPLERQSFMREFRRELPVFASKLDFIDLTGLPMSELRKRVAALPEKSAILYTAINVDGAGVAYIPRDALVAIAEVANRPIVIDAETQVGYGGAGGFVASPTVLANETALLALRVLNGQATSTIPVSVGELKPIFDWRQLKRWNVAEDRLPPGSEIRFRELTAWAQYSWQIMLIVAALLFQTALIVGLLYEHRRRRTAETTSRSAMGKLAHMNRIATASELTASIAHEVNQPLAAMVANAGAGLRWLANKTPNLDEARSALQQIVSDGQRAGGVVGSIRTMFKQDETQAAPVDLNDLIQLVLGHLRGELQTQGIVVQNELSRPLPLVRGHSGQLQQVILNLVRNAADAMDAVADRARFLRVKSAIHDTDGVLVSIEDSGTGIDPKNIDRIFESFFTTKSQGMGMGLSICRSIIEAHQGRLWASSRVGHGSVFWIQLPAIARRIE